MAAKQFPVRLEQTVYDRLRLQARAEGRSMNEVVRVAIESHLESHKIPRERLRALASEIVARDADLLEALARA
jgi:hypothetical protein